MPSSSRCTGRRIFSLLGCRLTHNSTCSNPKKKPSSKYDFASFSGSLGAGSAGSSVASAHHPPHLSLPAPTTILPSQYSPRKAPLLAPHPTSGLFPHLRPSPFFGAAASSPLPVLHHTPQSAEHRHQYSHGGCGFCTSGEGGITLP